MKTIVNSKQKTSSPALQQINKFTAGIDIGSNSHFIAISPELDENNVREFNSFTRDLKDAVEWLKSKAITSVAMESTSVYWIPIYDMLEDAGIEVLLVNASHVKNVTGRKTDVLDCQWIQQLHSYGLLKGSFRPEGDFCSLRHLVRQRSTLIEEQSRLKLRMQKSLVQMNIQLHNVISEISGEVGMKILRDIAAGVTDSKILSAHHNGRYKCSRADIAKSLEGYYRREHVFYLKQCIELYDFYAAKIKDCDGVIEEILNKLSSNCGVKAEDGSCEVVLDKPIKKRRKNELHFEGNGLLNMIAGVDLTSIDGLDTHSVLKIIAEVGTDMSKWKGVKQFASWLGLSPGTKISGGKKLSTRTKRSNNKAAAVFRMAAYTLFRSKSELGAFLRRKRSQLGSAEAITATAHKIAKIFYIMLKYKVPYKDMGSEHYERKFKDKTIKKMALRARSLGYILVKTDLPIEEKLLMIQ